LSVSVRTTPRATSDLLFGLLLPTAAPEASSSMLFELSSTTSTLALPLTRYSGLLPMAMPACAGRVHGNVARQSASSISRVRRRWGGARRRVGRVFIVGTSTG
jgi:hypothetical protein